MICQFIKKSRNKTSNKNLNCCKHSLRKLMPPHVSDGPNTTAVYKRRVLFEKGPSHPDNHIDKTFLRGLQKNVNIRKYFLVDVIVNTSDVTQELSSVSSCVTSFIYLNEQQLPPGFLLGSSTLAVLLLYIIFIAEFSLHHWCHDAKRAFVFLAFILGLSPVLKTLTDTVSTDSIYCIAGILMIIHLVTHDYGLMGPIVKPALSLTAAIAASVTLASRLSTILLVFEFLVFAVELFALFPILRKKVQSRVKRIRVPLTIFLAAFSTSLVWSLSPIYAVLLLSLEIFINVFCPIIFIQWQRHKSNIYGPWDEAIIEDPNCCS